MPGETALATNLQMNLRQAMDVGDGELGMNLRRAMDVDDTVLEMNLRRETAISTKSSG